MGLSIIVFLSSTTVLGKTKGISTGRIKAASQIEEEALKPAQIEVNIPFSIIIIENGAHSM